MKNDPRSCERNLCNQDFNGIWTRELAIPMRSSNQLSYEATGSWSMMCSYVRVKETVSRNSSERTTKEGWISPHIQRIRKHRWTHSDWNCGFWKLVRPKSISKFIFVVCNVWYNDILLEAVVQFLLSLIFSPRGWFGLRTEVLGKFVWKNFGVMYNNNDYYFVYYFIFLPPGLSIVCYTRTLDFLCPPFSIEI